MTKKKIVLVPFSSFMEFNTEIGCGYCKKELTCEKRNPKINKAKLGCEDYEHYKEEKQL